MNIFHLLTRIRSFPVFGGGKSEEVPVAHKHWRIEAEVGHNEDRIAPIVPASFNVKRCAVSDDSVYQL